MLQFSWQYNLISPATNMGFCPDSRNNRWRADSRRRISGFKFGNQYLQW